MANLLNILNNSVRSAGNKVLNSLEARNPLETIYNASPIGYGINTIQAATRQASPLKYSVLSSPETRAAQTKTSGGNTGPADVNSGGGGGSVAGLSASDLAYLRDQAAQLNSLLGRTVTNLNQGLQQNEDQYNEQVGGATQNRDTQTSAQKQARTGAYDQIRQNANTGFNSLAQVIGRSAGRNSSAYKELLPNVIGKDTALQSKNTSDTYGQNLSEIDNSYNAALQDLLKQKKQNESSVRTGYEQQRQDILNQLSQNAAAQNQSGGYEAAKAAMAPLQQQIEQSRNNIEGFFNQFRTPYTAPTLDPKLAQFQTDRSTINAQAQGAPDPTNPYTSILKKQLQGGQ